MTAPRFKHGLVIGKFYPPHRGHEYLIRSAAAHCAQVTVAALASSVESIPIDHRVAWLRDALADAANVRIIGGIDDVPIDYDDPAIWLAHVAIMQQAVARADAAFGACPPVDAVFSSEAYGEELARHFAAQHHCVDIARNQVPISATRLRNDPVAHWAQLLPAARAALALRVVIVGAESTGTTTLANDLTAALRSRGGSWAATQNVPEYGREFSALRLAELQTQNPDAGPEDIVWHSESFSLIAAEQTRQEDVAARTGGPVLICDTDALATCIWHERYMGSPSPEVEAIAAAMPPRALYLLTDVVGVPFDDDGLRDGEHLREWMDQRFRQVLSTQSVPWASLRGSPQARCTEALALIDDLVAQAWKFELPLELRSTT